MFSKILIANRGEIACRVMRTAHRMGIGCVAIYSDADRDALHVALADEAYRVGPPPAKESYLNIPAILEAARQSGAEAVHPGYGFLSENPEFIEACRAAGLVFIGPPPKAVRAMGLKDAAKRLMEQSGVPVVPGYHGGRQEPVFLAEQAGAIGYPVLIKARAGGGGKGMRRVDQPEEFAAALESARREAVSSFGDDQVIIERYVAKPRHIEIQVFADAHGRAVHLFERDCSLQRRHQKVIEEAPAPGMLPEMRAAMGAAAAQAALAVGYQGAGTVEFIVDASEGLRADRFYFMEMNTRLQVEHPVTEAITGLDLVEWQLRVAAGEPLPAAQDQLAINGHAFEVRLYAEDPQKNFLPATGTLSHLHLPDDLARIDTGVRQGDTISPYYDPMIAKLIVHGDSRAEALGKLGRALKHCRTAGCTTNIGFLSALVALPSFAAGDVDTGLIERALPVLTAEETPSAKLVAVAALAALGSFRKPVGNDPWVTLSGWRLWNAALHYALLDWRGLRIEVAVTAPGDGRYEATHPGGTITLKIIAAEGDCVRLDLGGRIVEAVIAEEPQAVSVFMDGGSARFGLPSRLADSAEENESNGSLIAPMPGVVRLVSAKAGQKVAKGEALIVIEAMKMEHVLAAPRDGSVEEVMVALGEQVEDGALLLRLAEPPDEGTQTSK